MTRVVWAATAAMAVPAGLSLVGADGSLTMLAILGLAPLLFLPAHVAVGYALATRRWILLGVAALVALWHFSLTVPELRSAVAVSDEVRAAPALTVVSANLFADNRRVDDLVAELLAADADLLVLQELTPAHWVAFETALGDDVYPHRAIAPLSGTQGSGVVSRWPLDDRDVDRSSGAPQLSVTVEAPGGPIRVVDVHPPAPINAHNRLIWATQLDDLTAEVDHQVSVLLVGDFNATWQHRPFRAIIDAGFTDVHVATGHGWQRTWPNDRWHPPLLRLDHVLAGPGLVALDAGTGSGAGSDHRPVWATIAVVAGD